MIAKTYRENGARQRAIVKCEYGTFDNGEKWFCLNFHFHSRFLFFNSCFSAHAKQRECIPFLLYSVLVPFYYVYFLIKSFKWMQKAEWYSQLVNFSLICSLPFKCIFVWFSFVLSPSFSIYVWVCSFAFLFGSHSHNCSW